jgi:hypothetical protein
MVRPRSPKPSQAQQYANTFRAQLIRSTCAREDPRIGGAGHRSGLGHRQVH